MVIVEEPLVVPDAGETFSQVAPLPMLAVNPSVADELLEMLMVRAETPALASKLKEDGRALSAG